MTHEAPVSSYPALTDLMIVSLINLLDRDSFADDLATTLETRFGYPHFHIFLYRGKFAPVNLASRPCPPTYQRGLKNYLTHTYVINPAYRAYQAAKPPGVYMISDLVGNDDNDIVSVRGVDVHIEGSEPIGYRTPGWPQKMAEVIMLINLPNGTALDFSFLNPLGSTLTQDCKRSLEQLFPILNGIVLKQFALCPHSLDTEATTPGHEDRFHDFGRDALTAREREISQMILIGHNSRSISLSLGIALPTVKTHRRNIYRKLRISSQAELFRLFMLHLK